MPRRHRCSWPRRSTTRCPSRRRRRRRSSRSATAGAGGASRSGSSRSCSSSASRSRQSGWYARKDYFVALDHGRVDGVQGRAGWTCSCGTRRSSGSRRSPPTTSAKPTWHASRDEPTFSSIDRRQRLRHDARASRSTQLIVATRSPVTAATGAATSSASASWPCSSRAAATCCSLLAEKPDLPADLWVFLAAVLGLYLVAHLAVRRFAPRADADAAPARRAPQRHRVRHDLAARPRPRARPGGLDHGRGRRVRRDAVLVRRVRTCSSATGTRSCSSAVVALLAAAAPGRRARDQRRPPLGARSARSTSSRARPAKVLLVIFFAAYLVDKRELLATGSRRIGRLRSPTRSTSARSLLAWGVSILVMVRQKDLGSSLLFFAVFAAMLYIATERARVPRRRVRACSSRGAAIAYQLFAHVQDRVQSWIDPWPVAQTDGLPDRAVAVRVRHRRLRRAPASGSGARRRSPTRRPTSCSPPSARSSGSSARSRCSSLFLLFVGSGFRIAVAGRPPVLEAVRRRAHHHHRRADVRHHRRRDPRDPAHRRDAAVRLLRRIVAHRELRDPRAAAAHLRRDVDAESRPRRPRRRRSRRRRAPRCRRRGEPRDPPRRRRRSAC